MATTIKDVARRAGLSISTVSKYLNGLPVREANRLRIEEAIHALAFRVNPMARGLRTRKTMTVGVLIPDLEISFFPALVAHIERSLQRHGYSVLLSAYAQSPRREVERIRMLQAKRVDAMILVPHELDAEVVCQLQESGIPVVLVDRDLETAGICDAVLVDNYAAARQAMDLLLDNGHRRIGLILGPQDVMTARERRQGCLDALTARGLPLEAACLWEGAYDFRTGYEGMHAFLSREQPPTAVFATNHDMMFGAVMAMNERAVQVPERLSFVGFDNEALAKAVRPRLTHVLQPLPRMGEAVAELVLRRLQGDWRGHPETARLQAMLWQGESIRDIRRET